MKLIICENCGKHRIEDDNSCVHCSGRRSITSPNRVAIALLMGFAAQFVAGAMEPLLRAQGLSDKPAWILTTGGTVKGPSKIQRPPRRAGLSAGRAAAKVTNCAQVPPQLRSRRRRLQPGKRAASGCGGGLPPLA